MSAPETPDLSTLARVATAGLLLTGGLALLMALLALGEPMVASSAGIPLLAAALAFGILLHLVATR